MSNYMDFWRGWKNAPIRDLANMQRALDNMFNEAYVEKRGEFNFNPACEVKEDKTHYLVKFDLPGIPKEALKVELHENTLTVSGERKDERRDDKKHLSEMYYGNFMRSFTFPMSVDSERVDAKFDNGVLTLAIPKTEASRARQISVK